MAISLHSSPRNAELQSAKPRKERKTTWSAPRVWVLARIEVEGAQKKTVQGLTCFASNLFVIIFVEIQYHQPSIPFHTFNGVRTNRSSGTLWVRWRERIYCRFITNFAIHFFHRLLCISVCPWPCSVNHPFLPSFAGPICTSEKKRSSS